MGQIRLALGKDRERVQRDVQDRPIYLGLAMTQAKRVRLKPQNLLSNLPLATSA